MTLFWLNKSLNPIKLKTPLPLSLRTQVLLRNAAFCSRIDSQILTKPKGREGKIWRKYCNVLQRETSLDLCTFTLAARKFHGSGSSVRYQEEKKPESLQELVEATERPQTALTVGQKGQGPNEVLGRGDSYPHNEIFMFCDILLQQ